MFKFLSGKQAFNKERAMGLFLALHPDAERSPTDKRFINWDGKCVKVSAYTANQAMISKVRKEIYHDLRRGKHTPEWAGLVDLHVLVRELNDGRVVLYYVTDLPKLYSFLGEDGAGRACVSWSNVQLAAGRGNSKVLRADDELLRDKSDRPQQEYWG